MLYISNPPALRMDGPTDFSNKNLDFHNNGSCRGKDYGSKPPVLFVRPRNVFPVAVIDACALSGVLLTVFSLTLILAEKRFQ